MEIGDIEPDADQARAAARLARLLDGRGRPRKRQRGVYLHGRPGRGKTMVLNRFYASVDSERKRRFHFHEFFAELHSAAHESGSIQTAIEALTGNARLVCFDEFHVHDIGDAMLIARMLRALFARRTTLVVTSNYPPNELLPNPLFHAKFQPSIDEIQAHLDVLAVDGPLDYRTRATARGGFTNGCYLVGPAPAAGQTEIRVGTRHLIARSDADGCLAIDFAALCGTPTAAADYVQLAHRYPRWLLRDIPPLRTVPPDWTMRLVNLVDVLYDADSELTVYAAEPLPGLLSGVVGVPDLARAASRLGELQNSAAAGQLTLVDNPGSK
ncbi:cell division protein ZapE [Nocardia arthritidis]|uniref:Cell division protein ZapE n=1 Tax=Nocardia arthritidis TaxID=228602 RepID=A0A6G9Y5B8_9NOCA|nr:cell division protein ZapE [Nocardia arthritidis]QIS08435.1 cell division protein ZapE [Nocardia arthritidis]